MPPTPFAGNEQLVSAVYQPSPLNSLQSEPFEGHYRQWGYAIGYENGADNNPVPENGNTAIFRIFPGGMTEPVYVTKPEADATFTVNVLAGNGRLIRARATGEVEDIAIEAGSEVVIYPGDAYVYQNNDEVSDLILHDVALPAFRAGDDAELTSSKVTENRPTPEDGYSSCVVTRPDGETMVIDLPTQFYELIGQAGRQTSESTDSTETLDPDFEKQIEHAFKHPLQLTLSERKGISPEEIAERERYYSRQQSLPDNSPTFIHEYQPQDHEVMTLDPAKYALLLAQTMRHLEIAKGNPDPGVKITPEIQKAADHELAHGKMSQQIGVTSAYKVNVIHDKINDVWALGPGHVLMGPAHITKLESAAISVAPVDASKGDLVSAQAAGYTSREEVLDKFYAAYPHLKPTS